MNMKQTLKTIAKRTPLLAIYRHFVERYRMRREARHFWNWSCEDQTRFEFYRQFIATGDLVFDIGANFGNRTKVFSRLGAVTVAIEPQTACADFLHSVFKDTANFHLVRKALGAAAGQVEMLISNAHSISSLSPDWVRSVKESGRFSEYNWDRKEMVLIDTLDNLIAQYGRPAFMKIDVEGFEEQVISGLSIPVEALSIEFAHEFIKSTFRCIEHLCHIGDYQYQISFGESMEFLLPKWVTTEEIRKALSEVPLMSWGDVYARSIAQ